MLSTLILAAALSQAPQAPQAQWYRLTNLEGWEGYGKLNQNGWVLTEKFRRIDNPAVEVPPAAEPEQPRAGQVPVQLASNATPAQAVGANVAVSEDPYGFLGWLNATRAAYGLPAVGHDPNLSSWAALNNSSQASRGLGHYVMGPARRQNSAVGGWPGGMWMASGGHRAALLDPTIRWIGIAALGGYWTFNAY